MIVRYVRSYCCTVKLKKQMRYQSTRGGVKGASFEEVLLSSFAPDGGLYVPESLPRIPPEQMRAWAGLSYPQLVEEVLSLFVSPDELSPQEIHEILKGCYDKFDCPEVIPMVKVGPVHVAETWHGPTGVFKDLTLPALARLIDHFLQKRGQIATILVSTTGDTGSATIHSALGTKNLRVIVTYPRYTVSRIQELQMTTTGVSNATVFSHEGNSDDLDLILKNIFTDPKMRQKHVLLSFNSIHTIRVVLNIAHYIFMYLRVAPAADKTVLISVPTGGMGNTTGGFMATRMGFPIEIMSAVNENDIIHRALSFRDFSITGPITPTFAMSLDSNCPFNIERVFFYALDGDCKALTEVMERFEQKQKNVLPDKILQNTTHLCTTRVTKDECLETIEAVWQKYGYVICPHTAIAMRPALEYAKKEDSGEGSCDSVVVIATATGAKFPDTLQKVGVPVPTVPWARDLHSRAEEKLFLNKGEDWERTLREAIASSER